MMTQKRMLRIGLAGCVQVLMGLTCFAQDTLVLKDGSELYVKVLEVGEHSVSYKKKEHLDGPTYTIDFSKVFMAIYKGGNRETFEPAPAAAVASNTHEQPMIAPPQKESNEPISLSQNGWGARLTSATLVPDKKNNIVSAMVEVSINGKKLFDLSVLVSQRKQNTGMSYANVNKNYYLSNSIAVTAITPKRYRDLLFEKYENYTGNGLGWAIPADFFSPASAACSVTYLQFKHDLRDVVATDGTIPVRKSMLDCSSVEYKIVSFALLWAEENFGKK